MSSQDRIYNLRPQHSAVNYLFLAEEEGLLNVVGGQLLTVSGPYDFNQRRDDR